MADLEITPASDEKIASHRAWAYDSLPKTPQDASVGVFVAAEDMLALIARIEAERARADELLAALEAILSVDGQSALTVADAERIEGQARAAIANARNRHERH